jgi:hypothetical protein
MDTAISSITQTSPLDVLLQAYIETLNYKEKKSYLIAKSHLGSSFQLEKSTGFVEWKKNLQQTS